MDGSNYIDSLPLAERLHREDPLIAARIYSDPVRRFLEDGVVILTDVIPRDILDRFDEDLLNLSRNGAEDPILGSIEIDGPRRYYEARYLRNLGNCDFRQEPPGLKLVDLQRFFPAASELAFAPAIMSFMEELFGSPAALIQSLTFWKGSEQSLHQDFSYVHHHSKLAHLAAAWIPLEDIQPEAGPLVYYPGSHRPDQLGFYNWGNASILASRDVNDEMANGYTEHLNRIVSGNGLEPRIFLPRRGDLLIWHGALIHGGTAMLNPELTRRSFICHYTSMASHKQAQRFRVGSGYCFDQPPSAAYQPSRLRRLASGVARGLGIRST